MLSAGVMVKVLLVLLATGSPFIATQVEKESLDTCMLPEQVVPVEVVVVTVETSIISSNVNLREAFTAMPVAEAEGVLLETEGAEESADALVIKPLEFS